MLPQAFTYRAESLKFASGDRYTDLKVVSLFGPDGARACAYCCNMNIDIDGEPQAYGPLVNPPGKPDLKPKENLWNGGFLSPVQNAARKAVYDAAKAAFDALEKQKADVLAKAKAAAATAAPAGGGPPPAKPAAAPDPALAALEGKIEAAKKAMVAAASSKWGANNWNDDPRKRPKNFGKVFWNWFGPVSAPKGDKAKTFTEHPANGPPLTRHLALDENAMFEDVNGEFPVVQSDFEPGPGYYVTGFPLPINLLYPRWDQRAYLPVSADHQPPFAALSWGLEQAAARVTLGDMVFAVRLDGGQTLAMPFRDRGGKGGQKLGECSVEAFTALGGVLAANINASPNAFMVSFLALAGSAGDSQAAVLAKFASATNADDFPVLLSFIARTTVNATAGARTRPISVGGDPVHDFERWKKSQGTGAPTALPAQYAVINQALTDAGFSPFAQRTMRKHPGMAGGGPWLTPPTKP